MKALFLVGCIVTGLGALAEGSRLSSEGDEPVGGLADLALKSFGTNQQTSRTIKRLFDEQASPSVFLRPATSSFRKGTTASGKEASILEQKRQFMTNLFASIGTESSIVVGYHNVTSGHEYSMKIIRCQSQEAADRQWLIYREATEFRCANVDGREVIYVVPNQPFPGGMSAPKGGSVRLKEGRYLIEVRPAAPNHEDPGLSLAWEQANKIKKSSEPASAAIQSQPVGSQTNRSPTAAVSGR